MASVLHVLPVVPVLSPELVRTTEWNAEAGSAQALLAALGVRVAADCALGEAGALVLGALCWCC